MHQPATSSRTRFRRAGALPVLAAACALAACRGAAPVAEPPPSGAPAPTIDRSSALEYVVDTGASSLTILVYRAGALASFGHNHVIESRDLQGSVWLDDRRGRSAFELSLPTARLIIDDPAARRAAGEDFPGEIPAEDIEGTRGNMLGERLLKAESFPEILIRSDAVIADSARLDVPVTVVVKGESRRLRFPVTLERADGRLTATGETEVTHAELGLEPFSVMLGALSVAEEIRLRYHIEAVPR